MSDVIENKYGYHITTKDNMASICQYGLLPMIGDRSQSVDETEKMIYYFSRECGILGKCAIS